jgi:hypothetical protein
MFAEGEGEIEFKSAGIDRLHSRSDWHYYWGRKMLTMMAILIGPALVAGVFVVTFFDIKATWDRNGLR